MILAAEPVRMEIPDQTYDHRTQTSTFKGEVDKEKADKRLKLAYSSTSTTPPVNTCRPCMPDSDSD
jgi:hypothetical protein